MAQREEQLVNFLRNKHRGRFVEDQDLCAAEQDLQNLDPLTHTDAELGRWYVEVDVCADRLGELVDLFPGGVEVDAVPVGGFGTEDDVLEHSEIVGEHEVLMHHADARRDCF